MCASPVDLATLTGYVRPPHSGGFPSDSASWPAADFAAGDRAKDPKSTQTQLRHADPTITLRHYQKSIPASVRAAGDQLERDLAFGLRSSPAE